jgi:RimJ/RimL family protein N-acetyltransferase
MSDAFPDLHLRPVTWADLPELFRFQCDAESSSLAGVIPRSEAAFYAVWEKTMADPRVVARVIASGPKILGSIACFRMEGEGEAVDALGYWIARDHWGKGVATRAVAMFLEECPRRPLHAHVAAPNIASLKVLARNGFTEVRRRHSPATERYTECLLVELILTAPSEARP